MITILYYVCVWHILVYKLRRQGARKSFGIYIFLRKSPACGKKRRVERRSADTDAGRPGLEFGLSEKIEEN